MAFTIIFILVLLFSSTTFVKADNINNVNDIGNQCCPPSCPPCCKWIDLSKVISKYGCKCC